MFLLEKLPTVYVKCNLPFHIIKTETVPLLDITKSDLIIGFSVVDFIETKSG